MFKDRNQIYFIIVCLFDFYNLLVNIRAYNALCCILMTFYEPLEFSVRMK